MKELTELPKALSEQERSDLWDLPCHQQGCPDKECYACKANARRAATVPRALALIDALTALVAEQSAQLVRHPVEAALLKACDAAQLDARGPNLRLVAEGSKALALAKAIDHWRAAKAEGLL